MRENRICLTHGTADRLLETRAAYGAELEPASLQAGDFTPHVDVMREGVNELFGEEVDLVNVLVGVGKDYRDGSDVACHRFYGELPSGSILYAEEGIYVASPYLNLLLEARDLHLVNLCSMLGRYLGTFSTTASGGSSDEIVSRAPLVREPELSRYLSRFKNTAGTGNLREALRFTCENAASPQEVNLQLALCLPPSCNGFALRKPVMNYPIKLDGKDRRFYDADYICIDLYWPEAGFGLEYQGEKEHKDRMVQDISRWYAALQKGIELWFVTKEQLGDAVQMDFIAREVARRTKKRINEQTWPTVDEAQLLLDVLRSGKWLNPDERLRKREIRRRRRVA